MQQVPSFWQPSWSEKTILTALGQSAGLSFVWEEGSAIVGFVCAHDLGFRAYLSELIAAPESQNRGIASALLAAVERVLTQRGQSVLIADVWRDAESFYRGRGWTAPNAVLLRRRLG